MVEIISWKIFETWVLDRKTKWDLIYIGLNFTSHKSKHIPIKLILCINTLYSWELVWKNILWSHFHSFVTYEKITHDMPNKAKFEFTLKSRLYKTGLFSSCPSSPTNLEEKKNTFWGWIPVLWCRSVNI